MGLNDLRANRVTPEEIGTELRWSKVTGPDAIRIIDRDWIRYVRILFLFSAVVLAWRVMSWQESKFDAAAANAALSATLSSGSIPDSRPTIRPIILPTVRGPASIDSLPANQTNAPDTTADESQPSTEGAPDSPAGPSEYVVQPGDTLGGIAAAVTVPIEALMELNGITDSDQIQVGQLLKVPNPSRRLQGPTTPDTYTVAPGDTLAAVAERLAADVDELARINGIDDPNSIVVGLVLLIP